MDNVPIRRHGAEATDCFRKWDADGIRRDVGDHHAKTVFGNQPDRTDAKPGAQHAIKRRGHAATLQVPEHANPRFFAGALLNFVGHHRRHATEARLAKRAAARADTRRHRTLCDEFSALLPRALGHDDERVPFAVLLAVLNFFADAFETEGNLGNQAPPAIPLWAAIQPA